MIEVWKEIKGYEGLYEVSNLGNVKSIRNNKNLKPIKVNKYKDYYKVALCKDGKSNFQLIHRLVAEAFILNPDNKPQIDHINTDSTDNRSLNLRWVDSKENSNNPLTIKHHTESMKKYNKSVLNVTTGEKFESIMEASRYYNCNPGGISKSIKLGCKYLGYEFKDSEMNKTPLEKA